MAKSNQKEVTLTSKDIDRINRYVIDNSKYVPGKVKASAKWQADSSKVLKAIGIS
jgi:hypothetical protein